MQKQVKIPWSTFSNEIQKDYIFLLYMKPKKDKCCILLTQHCLNPTHTSVIMIRGYADSVFYLLQSLFRLKIFYFNHEPWKGNIWFFAKCIVKLEVKEDLGK